MLYKHVLKTDFGLHGVSLCANGDVKPCSHKNRSEFEPIYIYILMNNL